MVFVHASLVREAAPATALESGTDDQTPADDYMKVVTWKRPLCVVDDGTLARMHTGQIYPAIVVGVCVGIVEAEVTGRCDTRTSECDWPCGDGKCYEEWTGDPDWPFSEYADQARAVAEAARIDPGAMQADGFAKLEEYMARQRDEMPQVQAATEAQITAVIEEDVHEDNNGSATELPSPDSCFSVEEVIPCDHRDNPSTECRQTHLKITNSCPASVQLYMTFVRHYWGDYAESQGLIGRIENLWRFPNNPDGPYKRVIEDNNDVESDQWATLLEPGQATRYTAYGSVLDAYGVWRGKYFICAQYHPLSVHESTEYATCQASNVPKYYWTCFPDGGSHVYNTTCNN